MTRAMLAPEVVRKHDLANSGAGPASAAQIHLNMANWELSSMKQIPWGKRNVTEGPGA
ncbi:hypothetical protein GCM10017674_78520 [Streptomyces gardneri]|uniref:Uncharacterized protein n=1 Tax=Streptomyces gardneri TaxID=66892 RepID=A0A4Y3RJP6_9ACTN|nr:hypothetical protein SGA01_27730 [Streptomyces gardneri]GHH22604.1 hypothetical protein GCM10017674_78520 [Streptomyces gardneri]